MSVPLDGEKLALPRLSLTDHVILVLELESSVSVTVQVKGGPLEQSYWSIAIGLTDHFAIGGVGDGDGVGEGVGDGVGEGDGIVVGDADKVGDGDGDSVGVGVEPESSVSVTGMLVFPPFDEMWMLAELLPICRLLFVVSTVTRMLCGRPPGCMLPLERLNESQGEPLAVACH